MKNANFIPSEKYDEIVQLLPICCVDIIMVNNGKLLVIKRGESETYGGSWWIPGGRVYKGESWDSAVTRKSFEETGLSVNIDKQVLSYEAPHVEEKHFVTTLFITSVVGSSIVKLDKTSTDYKWVNSIDPSWHSLLKQMLLDAEVFNE